MPHISEYRDNLLHAPDDTAAHYTPAHVPGAHFYDDLGRILEYGFFSAYTSQGIVVQAYSTVKDKTGATAAQKFVIADILSTTAKQGITLVSQVASTYGYICREGVVSCLPASSITEGMVVMPSVATAGTIAAATNTLSQRCGKAMASTTGVGTLQAIECNFLNI